MNKDDARSWIIKSSLSLIVLAAVFFWVAPAAGFPLTREQADSVVQLILPVLAGYVGAAALHLVKNRSVKPSRTPVPYLKLMVMGPPIVTTTLLVVVLSMFGWSNRAAAEIGTGWSVNYLTNSITGILSLQTFSTGVLIAYLFD